MNKQHYTYMHRNPEGHVFYVGCATTQPNKRGVRAKLGRAYATSGHTPEWHSASASGYTVEILRMFDDRNEAFEHEKLLIAEMRSAGEPLVNKASGGAGMPGVKDSDEVRQKKAVTKIGELNPMHGKVSPRAKPVIDMQAGVFYSSVQDAADHLGYKMQTLWSMLKGINPNNTSLRFA